MPKRQVEGQGGGGDSLVILGLSVAAVLAVGPLVGAQRGEPADVRPSGPVVTQVLSRNASAADALAATGLRASPLGQQDDAYYRRLDIHRAASYALLPLFALQYFAGDQLYQKSSDAPDWAKVGHRVGATGIAALFTVNVATGVPNIIAARKEPRGRGRRTLHGSLMLLATAGFVATGILSERAEGSPEDRDLHRSVALSSMGVATVGFLTMTDLFRRD